MSVRYGLLALLSEGPKYGLQLREEFEARTGEVWPLNVGQVYSTLQRLEKAGLIAPEGAHDTREKVYRLMPLGRAALQEWLESPAAVGPPERDELVIRVLIGATVPDVDLLGLLQGHRRHLVEVMQQYTSLKADAEHDVAFLMVADAEIFRAEAQVRWLDACEARLRDMTLPVPTVASEAKGVAHDRV